MSDTPLAGIKVLELARVLAGPWAGQTLADLGADVIKIEAPSGDETRAWGPPFVADRSAAADDSAYFHACNRGKRAFAIDLKTAQGQAQVRRLAQDCDVLIENFKVGGLAKYGLDYPQLSARNRRLIYCSISGFGQDGPSASEPGYDSMIQARAGLMSITGSADEPQKVGVAVIDLFAGLYAVTAIQAALWARNRSGQGQAIDISLFEVAVAILANQAQNYLTTGLNPERLGNAHPNIVPYQAFPTTEGQIVIAAGNDRQFAALARLLGCPDFAQDPRFLHNQDRVRQRDILIPELAARTQNWSRQDLLAQLKANGVPAGPIQTLSEVFADPQTCARGMVKTYESGPAAGHRYLATPMRFSSSQSALGTPPPKLMCGKEETTSIDWEQL